jgi:signal peptidase I
MDAARSAGVTSGLPRNTVTTGDELGGRGPLVDGAGRGVTPGAEPDAGSDRDAESADWGQSGSIAEPGSAGQGSAVPGPRSKSKAESGADTKGQTGKAGAEPGGDAEPGAGAEPGGGAEPGAGAEPGSEAAADSAGSGGAKPRRATARSRGRRFVRELVILVVIALVIAVAIKTYAIQAFFIPSGSMQNTLEINDRVLVNKIVYDTRPIHRGDIVVFNGDGSWDPGSVPTSENFAVKFADGFASMFGFGHPGDILIKRVIGLPGDTVACCDAEGRVTVNGVPLSEQSYLFPGDVPSQSRFNITVPPGRLWVMGDHRSISDDSRDHEGDPGGGTIPESAVLGRAFVIIWPPSQWRILPIPATFEQSKLNASSAASTSTSTSTSAAAASTDGLLAARLEPSGSALPLSLGFAAAVPVSWLQRRVRRRITGRRAARPGSGPPAS